MSAARVGRLRQLWAALAGITLVVSACSSPQQIEDLGDRDQTSPEQPTSSTTVTPDKDDATVTTAPSQAATSVPLEPIRTITPDEWTFVRSTCLTERGFPVTVMPDGGLSFSGIPSEQQSALQAALEECDQLYPIDPVYRQPLDRDQIRLLYDWYVEVSVPCLEGLGYSGFDPPTFDVFADTYSTGPWTPYHGIGSALDSLQESDWYDLQDACPQSPPLDYLFGS